MFSKAGYMSVPTFTWLQTKFTFSGVFSILILKILSTVNSQKLSLRKKNVKAHNVLIYGKLLLHLGLH